MKYKYISKNNLKISNIGLGCMGMSEFYGTTNDYESKQTIKKAYELGINHFDTADVYGSGHNEYLLGNTIKEFGIRDNVHIATKCRYVVNDQGTVVGVNGTKEYIKKSCENSLKRLKTDYIDLYYLHRVDPYTPIEISMKALSELVQEGKILNIGLSEVDSTTINKAHSIHPLTSIQSEYSILRRNAEIEIIPLCKSLNIYFIAFSPMCCGLLTNKIKSSKQLKHNDLRKIMPRFQNENFDFNYQLVSILANMALKKHCTTAQLALAWVLTQEENVLAISGTKHTNYLQENMNALNIALSNEEKDELNSQIPIGIAKGSRFPPELAKILETHG